ncbi:hypothetical protein K1T71_006019 [Dendrolimus kikuchii]|uniref:Uncharacterized protein n=1 Tax=Dendrolimus kikuchii TaxID=765133 RepID=A0ACC1D2X6_9NEOP|nr:hypothetical protein K1T71_006019 [Dendrolimus kikuchii]
MSEIFHKSCYTSRSSGYKYRTLSTNTGDKRKRDCKEDTTFDKKFKELKKEIVSRVDKQVNETRAARELIQEKFNKIDSKINSMLDLKQSVMSLREDLTTAENNLANLINRVYKLELTANCIEGMSLKSSSFRSSTTPILEEKEIFSSNI